MLAIETARHWVDRWDRQQETFLADREERFAVIADAVEAGVERQDPLVLDVGCGPGSLGVRLVDRLPGAHVVGVDADPLLLGLASGAYGDRAGLRWVDTDLRQRGWVDALGLDGPADAVVSTTALHWLHRDELVAAYRDFAGLLRPGGVYVDGDHMHEAPDHPVLDRVMRAVRTACEARAVKGAAGEGWAQWWEAVTAEPEFADLVAARGARPIEHNSASGIWYADRLRMLADAGFTEVGTVWQSGDDRVLVAVRG